MSEHHHATPVSPEETKALLDYMVKHNSSHTEELLSIAQNIEKENAKAYALLIKAIEEYKAGNKNLEDALKLLKQEK